MASLNDTIAAIATPPGEGGIGIVRISGARAIELADWLFVGRSVALATCRSHTIHYGILRDPGGGDAVDSVLALLFRAPHSYTGDDVVELSCHGGTVTLGRTLALVLRAGARPAEPGEFTRRAYLNGRMDLAQAEAVCDLIRARTEDAQRLALSQQAGALSREIEALRHELIGALAAVEASTDFSDEVGALDYDAMDARLAASQAGVQRLLATAARGRAYREGVRVTIVGRPNVGKSSLLNALLGADRAIVTDVAGTTRDVVEAAANIRGIPVLAADTAGLRPTDDTVERLGVRRAIDALQSASAVLFVLDASEGWRDGDTYVLDHVPEGRAVWVLNKTDLVDDSTLAALQRQLADAAGPVPLVPVSARTGWGLRDLEQALTAAIIGPGQEAATGVTVSNVRHALALDRTHESLAQARRTLSARLPCDLLSVDLRGALDALGLITGETATDEVIDRIFRDFCVGK